MFKILKSIGLLNFGTIILYANVWSWKRKRLWLNRDVFVSQVDEGPKTGRQEGKGRSGFRKSKQDSKRVWESQLTSWQPRNRSLTQESSVLALRVQLFWASRTARSASRKSAHCTSCPGCNGSPLRLRKAGEHNQNMNSIKTTTAVLSSKVKASKF